jgi:hypothetical protein
MAAAFPDALKDRMVRAAKSQQGIHLFPVEHQAHSLRVNPDKHSELDVKGMEGTWATWIPIHQGELKFMLKNQQTGKFLRIDPGNMQLDVDGVGGPYCPFVFKYIRSEKDGDDVIALESVAFPGQHVGVLPDRSIKKPSETHTGPHGQFVLRFHGDHVIQELHKAAKAGKGVHFFPKSYSRSLRVNPDNHSEINSEGGTGTWATWFPVPAGPGGLFMFKNQQTGKFLRIDPGNKKLDADGVGGPYCPFIVKFLHKEADGDNVVALESVAFDDHHVGVLPDGKIKDPHQTGTGPHGQFVIKF